MDVSGAGYWGLRVCVSLLVELDPWVSILFLFLRYSVLIVILKSFSSGHWV